MKGLRVDGGYLISFCILESIYWLSTCNPQRRLSKNEIAVVNTRLIIFKDTDSILESENKLDTFPIKPLYKQGQLTLSNFRK